MMEFVQGEIYMTRDAREFTYLERRGGVLVFESVGENEERLLTNLAGRYRWDDQVHPNDIIGILGKR